MDDWEVRFEERRKAREAQERTFTIAGQTLRFRPTIAPEVMFRFRASQMTMFQHLDQLSKWGADLDAAQKKNGTGEAEVADLMAKMPVQELTDDDLLLIADETVLACLEPDSHKAWGKLRDPKARQPLTYQDIFDVVGYLLARVADLPTVAPTDSPDGRTETAKPSKAASSSRAKTPARSG